MSHDNWERLVAAVIKKQQLWELFHAHSRNTSFSSVCTDFNSSFSGIPPLGFKQPILEINFNEFLNSANGDGPLSYIEEKEPVQDEWEQYELGVYMTRSIHGEVKRVQFSGIKFDAVQAKTWWLENQKEVYQSYSSWNGYKKFMEQEPKAEARWSLKKWKFYKVFSRSQSQSQTTQAIQTTISGPSKATSDKNKPFSKGISDQESRHFKSLGLEEPILEINLNRITESENLEGITTKLLDEWCRDGYDPNKCGGWIERYEAGVYLTISTLEDGTLNVERVRFSRNIFDAEQVKTWWLKNKRYVYERNYARER